MVLGSESLLFDFSPEEIGAQVAVNDLVVLIKASFGGDRSAAGRYAANIRWQGQAKKQDISRELVKFFGKDVYEFHVSEGNKEINKRLAVFKQKGTYPDDLMLSVIAEKQGFTGKPKVVSEQEMEQLEKEGWTIVYRGIHTHIERKTKLKAKDLAEQFLYGDYWAGLGTRGNGIYVSQERGIAEGYTKSPSKGGGKGVLLKIAIPPDALMPYSEFVTHLEPREWHQSDPNHVSDYFYGDSDVGRRLCAQGYRGAMVGDNMAVIWDRSMLAVQRLDKP